MLWPWALVTKGLGGLRVSGDGTMRAADCFRERTKGRVFRWGRRGSGNVGLYVEESVGDRCERWASEVKRGSRPMLYSLVERLVELEAVSCTPVVDWGWHEYQAAAACLIQPKSHARIQMTLSRSTDLTVQVSWWVWVRVRGKRQSMWISRSDKIKSSSDMLTAHKHSNTLLCCKLRAKVSGSNCTARTMCVAERRDRRLPWEHGETVAGAQS